MKICERGYKTVYLMNAYGDVTMCAWTGEKSRIGNILENDFSEIFKSDRAQEFFNSLINCEYHSLGCDTGYCTFMNKHEIEKHLTEYDGSYDYPESLSLGFEHICNYRCSYCSASHLIDAVTNNEQLKSNMDIIAEKARKVLPYVKHISANGNGEIFASPRTLKLLSEWKPIAPKEECSVWIETNGLLFDEMHWKQIENLGQYDLTVGITVNSFEEDIYQYLSGTNAPISKIEESLRFVAKLRREGIINRLQINNIVQEMNYRFAPSFAQRCIEEYGADYVNLRAIFIDNNAGGKSDYINWFFDLRNPKHPYYENYKKMLLHPIFKNPKVAIYQGDIESEGNYPGDKQNEILALITRLMNNPSETCYKIYSEIGKRELAIYGAGVLGKTLVNLLKNDFTIQAVFDRNACQEGYEGIKISQYNNEKFKDVSVILSTVYKGKDDVTNHLQDNGFDGRVIDIFDVFKQC